MCQEQINQEVQYPFKTVFCEQNIVSCFCRYILASGLNFDPNLFSADQIRQISKKRQLSIGISIFHTRYQIELFL